MLKINLQKKKLFNPFQATAPLLYPLKTSESVLLGIEIEQLMK